MRRRDFLGALAGLGLCAPRAARAAGKVPRIGYLVQSPLVDPPSPERAAFLAGLRALGYEDGRNVVIEYRSARSDAEMLPFLADELVASKVDIIVAVGTPPAVAARKATATIPIVFLFHVDPVGTQLVESLVRPGGNATGMSSLGSELGAKRLDLLKETLPRLSRVAVLWDSGFLTDSELKAIQATARSFGIAVQSVDIGGHPDLTTAFATLAGAKLFRVTGQAEEILPLGVPFHERKIVRQFPGTSTARQALLSGLLLFLCDDPALGV